MALSLTRKSKLSRISTELKSGLKKKKDVPFGAPPEEYNYRCSLCQFEIGVNEAIIDAEIGSAKFSGNYYDGFMPVLHCLACYQETMEYSKESNSPAGR